jgi:hypothetical protein
MITMTLGLSAAWTLAEHRRAKVASVKQGFASKLIRESRKMDLSEAASLAKKIASHWDA